MTNGIGMEIKTDYSVESRLTVFFEEPFWIGIFERICSGNLSVCKVAFGAEPTDAEIYVFILKHFSELKFTDPIKTVEKQTADNPKRRQRNARRQLDSVGVGTKSQQALQKQREEMKAERRHISRKEREAEKQRQFELKQKKRKEKHKGH